VPNANVARRWRWRLNPVVLKELRGRMRGLRAFVILTLYLSLMSAYVGVINLLYGASANQMYSPYSVQTLGKNIFLGLIFIELLLACFITPAVTASAVSGERERQTLDILRTTLLPTPALVLGKLASALVFVVLLLLAAVPLQSLSFLLGGVAPQDFAIATVILLATAFLFGSAGIFFSTVMRRTLGATVLTYAFALVSTLGLPLLIVPWSLFGMGIAMPIAFQVLGSYGVNLLVITNPFATAFVTQSVIESQHSYFYYTTMMYSNSGSNIVLPFLSPWLPFALFCALAGGVMLLISIGLVRRAER
jgi:ABC-2 type transport system permease protein